MKNLGTKIGAFFAVVGVVSVVAAASVRQGPFRDASASNYINGAGVASGNLDLNGNDLILDADGDTTITENADDIIDMNPGGSLAMRWSTSSITIAKDLILSGTGTEIYNASAVTEIGAGCTSPTGGVSGLCVTNDAEIQGRLSTKNEAHTLGAAATTFAIQTSFGTVTGDAGANTIATITGATAGDRLVLLFVDALVTITDDNTHAADSVDLSAAFTSADDTTLELIYDGTSWYEISRSVN